MPEGCTPPRPWVGGFTGNRHSQLVTLWDVQRAKVLLTGGSGGALLARTVPPSPFCLAGMAARARPGCWVLARAGSARRSHPPWGQPPWQAETALEPRGGRRGQGRCPFPTRLRVTTSVPRPEGWRSASAFPQRRETSALLEVSSYSSVVPRKDPHIPLLSKPKDPEAGRPSSLTPPNTARGLVPKHSWSPPVDPTWHRQPQKPSRTAPLPARALLSPAPAGACELGGTRHRSTQTPLEGGAGAAGGGGRLAAVNACSAPGGQRKAQLSTGRGRAGLSWEWGPGEGRRTEAGLRGTSRTPLLSLGSCPTTLHLVPGLSSSRRPREDK